MSKKKNLNLLKKKKNSSSYSPKNKKPKKKPIKLLRKKCDILWSVLVKARAGNKCEVCGKSYPEVNLNSHHIIGRKFFPLRFNPRNGVCLCVSNHQFSPNKSAHSNPIWFYDWLSKHRSSDLFFLKKNYEKVIKVDYSNTLTNLSKEIQKYPS